MSKLPWYKEGLRFGCTQCGQCCTGTPGFVWLDEHDITVLCEHLKLTKEKFLQTYTRLVDGKISLIEDPKNFDCVFLKNNKCSLYGARPKQCKRFPFWDSILESKEDWDLTQQYCEGINHPEGKLYSLEEITNQKESSDS